MDLHEFGHQMRDKVRAFEKYWREANNEDPDTFPIQGMTNEDWDIHFTDYLGA